jgi:hypothetical protein
MPALAGGVGAAAAAVIGAGFLLGTIGPNRSPDGGTAPPEPRVAATEDARSDALPATVTSTAAPSPRSAAPGPETAPAVVQALCRLEPRRVTELLVGATGDERYEALRDAIPELGTRLENLRTAAGGRPGVQPVIARVTALHGDWQVALQAHDEGDAGRGKAALARADADVAAVGAAMRVPLPDPSVCA